MLQLAAGLLDALVPMALPQARKDRVMRKHGETR